MARTNRNLIFDNEGTVKKCLRHPRTTQDKKYSILIEEENEVSNRNRIEKRGGKTIPTVYDDIMISALSEDRSWSRQVETYTLEELEQDYFDSIDTLNITPTSISSLEEAEQLGRKLAKTYKTLSDVLWVYDLPSPLFEAVLDGFEDALI